jgi:hypothetical protein
MKKAADLQVGDVIFVNGSTLRPKIQFPILVAVIETRRGFSDNTIRFSYFLRETNMRVLSQYIEKDQEFESVGE